MSVTSETAVPGPDMIWSANPYIIIAHLKTDVQ